MCNCNGVRCKLKLLCVCAMETQAGTPYLTKMADGRTNQNIVEQLNKKKNKNTLKATQTWSNVSQTLINEGEVNPKIEEYEHFLEYIIKSRLNLLVHFGIYGHS